MDNKFRQHRYWGRPAGSSGGAPWGLADAASETPSQNGPDGGPAQDAGARLRSKPVTDLGVLNERLGYFVRRLQVWVFQDFIRRLAAIDISPAQFSVLVVISANTGLSQAELAATLGIERARLVRLLHRLEARGLTQRLPSSADGRRHALRLTARRRQGAGAGQGAGRPSTRRRCRKSSARSTTGGLLETLREF